MGLGFDVLGVVFEAEEQCTCVFDILSATRMLAADTEGSGR